MGNTIIENWTLEFDYNGTISNIWNAAINSSDKGSYIIKNAGWNQDIEVGSSVEFGISGQENFPGFPKKYALLGSSLGVAEEDYSITYKLDSDWGSGYTGSVSITNNTASTIEDWYLEFDFNREITNIWNAAVESHSGRHYVIKNAGYNANINVGQTISFGFSGEQGSSSDKPINYELYSYSMYAKDNSKDLDSDSDGLTDYEEINITLTDPYEADTDGNGIIDSEEDFDRDGINSRDEIDWGTDPLNSDTDKDNLTDYEELYKYNTDPLLKDTDGDGLTDYDDVKLGFNPLLKDTDGNGIIDSEERIYQTVNEQFKYPKNEGVTAVSVSLSIKGNAENHIGIEDVYEFDKLSSGVVGLIGIPVEIGCNAEFDQADITFFYDVNALGDTKEEDLAILWYDEENCWYQILDEDSIVDTENHTVTYTTTHFSTYMLVDCKKWYESWREDLDYRNSSFGDTERHYFDIVFVVDASGSMGAMGMYTAKIALKKFVDAMHENDEAAVISFNSVANLRQDFTNDKIKLRSTISLISTGGLNIVNNGLLKAISTFENHDCDKQKIIVLFSDGDVDYVQETIDQCIADNIKIYTVNVFNVKEHELLEKMASQTGGEYYFVNDDDMIDTILACPEDGITGQIDPTDTDGDGLYDIFETVGIRLPNGRIIYTDPKKSDTDGDGLTDYQETGIVYNVDDRYIGYSHSLSNVQYFKLRSDPTMSDTDDDGLTDDVDEHPWDKDIVTVVELNSKFSEHYLSIEGNDGSIYHGGNQGWWSDKVTTDSDMNKDKRLYKDEYYRLTQLGCGIIAMSDAELYVQLQNSGYSLSVSTTFDENTQQTGICKYDAYRDYIEQMYSTRYKIDGNLLNCAIGLYPGDMEKGFSNFLKANNSDYQNAKWAMYIVNGKDTQKNMVLLDIMMTLYDNIPVVFSYYDKVEDITLYRTIQGAKENNASNATGTNSHYMTVIGLYKCTTDNSLNYKYVLKVVSWGDIYYIDYDEYADKLGLYTNILSVY